MLSVGQLLWASFRPLIRLVLCASSGFILTKTDNFPAVAARGAAQIMLNIALPCLMFSKIVSAFSSDHISALGPLVLVAVLYEVIGIIIAWCVKQVFWVPHRFRYGILVAGGWGNVGDIPTSVVMSITAVAPFGGASDQTLSVAYLSVFLLVFFLSLFPLGGVQWVAMDYVGPDIETEDIKMAIQIRRKTFLHGCLRTLSKIVCQKRSQNGQDDNEKDVDRPTEPRDLMFRKSEVYCPSITPMREVLVHDDSITVVPTETDFRSPSWTKSSTPADTQFTELLPSPTIHKHTSSVTPAPRHRFTTILTHVRTFLKLLFSPPSIAILLGFAIALIPPLKALFVAVPSVHMPTAPDGLPPLAFFFDTTTFIGGASVPLGLISLGSSLARLIFPRNREAWRALPIGSIAGVAAGRMIIMPVLGVLIVQGLVRGGVIPREDKVLQFVCIFCSCLPTATTQVFLTQVYSGTGTTEHLSAFLIPQYALMFFSMTGLTAYTLRLLF